MNSYSTGILFGLNHMVRIRMMRMMAILPLLLFATWNTGYQYLVARSLTDTTDTENWRGRIIENFFPAGQELTIVGALIAGLVHVIPVVTMSLVIAGIWVRIFASARNSILDPGFMYFAILFALFMHPAVSLFHVAFGMSFAMVFAWGIFGGEGRSFLNPALVGVAVVQISFPVALTDHSIWTEISGYAGTSSLLVIHENGFGALSWSGVDWWQAFFGGMQGLLGTTSVAAAILGGVILIYARIASLRLIAAHIVGLVLAAMIVGVNTADGFSIPWHWHLVLGSFVFGVVFLATDPSSSCVTNPGRWIQGLIAGFLVVLLREINPSHPDSVVPVLLLVSMLSPLIDHAVIWLNIRRRRMIHGR